MIHTTTPSGHYYDCDVCGERFSLRFAGYLREVEVNGEVEFHCPKHWKEGEET